jgi:acetyl esterase/lipase
MPKSVRPPFDQELQEMLPAIRESLPATITPEDIPRLRAGNLGAPSIDDVIGGRPITHRTITAVSADGTRKVELSVLSPSDGPTPRPALFFIHGGGMFMGDRFSGAPQYTSWVEELGITVVSVDYRLAPENPYPAAHDDCLAGYLWTLENVKTLGVDPARIVVAGASAGGGLAASLCLKLRDQNLPLPRGQLLIYPMLDDRNETVSSRQLQGEGVWDRGSNETGWQAYLGDRRGTASVEAYAAPARAEDLSGLPSTFIDVGTAEVFRDEVVSYAVQMWEHGGVAELHVWPGAFHGFDVLVPDADISRRAVSARVNWLRRLLET